MALVFFEEYVNRNGKRIAFFLILQGFVVEFMDT